MVKKYTSPNVKTSISGKVADERSKRQAAALRTNLHRRKKQMRERKTSNSTTASD